MKKIIFAALLGCLVAPNIAFGSAWTLPEGDVWMQYQMKWFRARSEYSPGSNRKRMDRNARSWGWTMIPEVHYGATDWLDIFVNMEYKESHYKEYSRPTDWGPYSVKNHGLVTIEPGVKVRLLEDPLVLSTQFSYSIWNKHYQSKPLEDVAEAPELSDRTNFWESRVIASKKWDTQLPFFMSVESGYRHNFRNVTDQIPLFYELGFWPLEFLLIKTELDFALGLHGTTKGNTVTNKSWGIWRIGPSIELYTLYDRIRGVDVSSDKYADSVTRAGKTLNVEVQYGNTFWGRNTAASQEIVLKVSTQF